MMAVMGTLMGRKIARKRAEVPSKAELLGVCPSDFCHCVKIKPRCGQDKKAIEREADDYETEKHQR